MVDWTQCGTFIYPITLSEAPKDAIAQAFVNEAGLESFANERLMFDYALPLSSDYGLTETHREIRTRLFPGLASAISAAIPDPGDGLWYVLNDAGDLLATNDPAKISGQAITHGLAWESGIALSAGEIIEYNGAKYEVLQAHTSQADWSPSVAVALFVRYRTPGIVCPWAQPVGAHDAYPVGARVSHNGTTWINTLADNVWEPGVVGWEDENATGEEWSAGVAYIGDNTAGAGNGDVVTYESNEYRCLQSHTSQIGWEPPNVPALWTAI